jgi:hypothetical protein
MTSEQESAINDLIIEVRSLIELIRNKETQKAQKRSYSPSNRKPTSMEQVVAFLKSKGSIQRFRLNRQFRDVNDEFLIPLFENNQLKKTYDATPGQGRKAVIYTWIGPSE